MSDEEDLMDEELSQAATDETRVQVVTDEEMLAAVSAVLHLLDYTKATHALWNARHSETRFQAKKVCDHVYARLERPAYALPLCVAEIDVTVWSDHTEVRIRSGRDSEHPSFAEHHAAILLLAGERAAQLAVDAYHTARRTELQQRQKRLLDRRKKIVSLVHRLERWTAVRSVTAIQSEERAIGSEE